MKRHLVWVLLCAGLLTTPLAAKGRKDPVGKRVKEIKRLEDQRADIEKFADYVEDDRIEVRRAVFRALGRLQDGKAVPALSFFLSDSSKAVRAEAIRAIGAIGKLESVDVLLAITRSSEPTERKSAAYGLGLVSLMTKKMDKAIQRRLLERLQVLLEDPSSKVRGQAALTLGFLGLPDGISPLAAAMKTTRDPEVRWRLVYAIGRIGGKTAVPHLTRAARFETIWCQEFAALYLGRNKSKSAASALPRLCASPRWKVAALAARGLGKHKSAAGIRALQSALGHWSWHVRAEAARALGVAEDRSSVALLRQRLDIDRSRSVRAALLTSLIQLDPEKGMALTRQIQQSAPTHMLVAAAKAVGKLASDGKRADALKLAKLLFDRGPHAVRTGVLDGIGTSKSPEAQGLLLKGLATDDLTVRGTAVYLLKGLGEPRLLDPLVKAYKASGTRIFNEVREYLVEAMGKIGKPAEPHLRAALGDPAPSVRARAASELKRILGREVPYKKPPKTSSKSVVDPFATLPDRPEVVLVTSKGNIRLQLYPKSAPIHVRNFLGLVARGFYDGLTWHRVVSAFVIQGGDPRGDGWGDPGYNIRDEINPHTYRSGTLGMPKAGKDTGGCQLFITHLPTPHLDGRYTVFGQVICGMGAVDRIEVGDTILRVRRVR